VVKTSLLTKVREGIKELIEDNRKMNPQLTPERVKAIEDTLNEHPLSADGIKLIMAAGKNAGYASWIDGFLLAGSSSEVELRTFTGLNIFEQQTFEREGRTVNIPYWRLTPFGYCVAKYLKGVSTELR